MYNLKHKYQIRDYNGLPRGSATTLNAAKSKARRLADDVGLSMSICYSDRTPLGMFHNVVNVRCHAGMLFGFNGQAHPRGK